MKRRIKYYPALPKKQQNALEDLLGGCLAVIIYSIVGGLCTNYMLWFFTGNQLPFVLAMVVGLFGGFLTIPATVITFVLYICHFITPFVG